MIAFEALTEQHDTSRFRSGGTYLDEYLRGDALRDQENDLALTFVALDMEEDPNIAIGFFTLRAIGQYIPPLPGAEGASDKWLHPAELAFLARHESRRGTGLGAVLLVEALRCVEEASRRIGLPGVFLYATNEGVNLYNRYGFRRLSEKKEFYLPLRDVRAIVQGIREP